MTKKYESLEILAEVTEIVAAYVSCNKIIALEIPRLIQQVHHSLFSLKSSSSALLQERPIPGFPIEQSVHPDYIICLEDGKRLKMLKRHLKAIYKMTPDQYRERWGLPADYPMVAPNYAKRRSALAKNNGLGMRRGQQQDVAA